MFLMQKISLPQNHSQYQKVLFFFLSITRRSLPISGWASYVPKDGVTPDFPAPGSRNLTTVQAVVSAPTVRIEECKRAFRENILKMSDTGLRYRLQF